MEKTMQSQSRFYFLGLFAVLAGMLVLLGRVHPTQAQPQQASTETEFIPPTTFDPSLNCRFGGTVSGDSQHEIEWLSTFGTGTFVGFTADQPIDTFGQEILRLIRVNQTKDNQGNYTNGYTTIPRANHIADIASGRPGYVWMIGNEIERGESQDDIFPEMYAVAYHELYTLIKNADPTARVAVGGMVQVTPGRLQYMTKVYNEYQRIYGTQMPVDVWNVHIYPLPELTRTGDPNDISGVALGTDPSLGLFVSDTLDVSCDNHTDNVMCYAEHTKIGMVDKQIRDIRQWMLVRGYQDRPLIISEMASLLPWGEEPSCFRDEEGQCFSRDRNAEYMDEVFNYLLNERDLTLGYPRDDYKLVQNWNWFSLYNDGVGFGSNLVGGGFVDREPGDTRALTPVGQTFKQIIEDTPNKPDLFFMEHNESWSVNAEGLNEVDIDVKFGNTGHVLLDETIRISLYENRDNPQLLATRTINRDLYGCGMNTASASFTWVADEIGINEYWIRVDRSNAIDELDESNNEVSGIFIVNPPDAPPPSYIYIPIFIGD